MKEFMNLKPQVLKEIYHYIALLCTAIIIIIMPLFSLLIITAGIIAGAFFKYITDTDTRHFSIMTAGAIAMSFMGITAMLYSAPVPYMNFSEEIRILIFILMSISIGFPIRVGFSIVLWVHSDSNVTDVVTLCKKVLRGDG